MIAKNDILETSEGKLEVSKVQVQSMKELVSIRDSRDREPKHYTVAIVACEGGWSVQMRRRIPLQDERPFVLETRRGGVRVFRSLDSVARFLIDDLCVSTFVVRGGDPGVRSDG